MSAVDNSIPFVCFAKIPNEILLSILMVLFIKYNISHRHQNPFTSPSIFSHSHYALTSLLAVMTIAVRLHFLGDTKKCEPHEYFIIQIMLPTIRHAEWIWIENCVDFSIEIWQKNKSHPHTNRQRKMRQQKRSKTTKMKKNRKIVGKSFRIPN